MTTRPTLRRWLSEAPFTLTLSSGFFGFFAHTGVVQALEEAQLWPRAVSGSSAGALVGALWAAGLDGASLEDRLSRLRRPDFWDPGVGLGLLRGRSFRSLLDAYLPVAHFSACRWPVVISVFDVLQRRTRVLQQGALAPAIVASCSVPLMFQPTWIDGRPFLDGGILDRWGLAGVGASERVFYHHLSTHSPWRRYASPARRVPARPKLAYLTIADLPRPSPFHLECGPAAIAAGRAAMRRALDAPVLERAG